MTKQVFALNFEPITGTGPFQTGGADPGGTFEKFFTALLGFLTVLGGLAFLIYFILGAFTWLTSQGDKQKVERAQQYMANAAIGLIAIILAWAVIGTIGLLLGVNFLDLVGLVSQIQP